MSRPPHNETSRPHALFLHFGSMLLVPVGGQNTAAKDEHRGFESVLWAYPGGGQYTTARLREIAAQRRLSFELVTVGGKPR